MSNGERSAETPEQDFEVDAPQGASTEEQFSEDSSDEFLSEMEDGEVVDGELVDDENESTSSEADDLGAVRAERDEYLDALRRLQAEFDNYRKRTVRQQTDLLGRAAESLLERMLPVLDALDLAVAHGEEPDISAKVLSEALQQISALARGTLAKEGLERIDTAGVEFDPTVHDAVAHLPREEDDTESGVVVDEVLRPGYQLKGRVLRPAMVRVRG